MHAEQLAGLTPFEGLNNIPLYVYAKCNFKLCDLWADLGTMDKSREDVGSVRVLGS